MSFSFTIKIEGFDQLKANAVALKNFLMKLRELVFGLAKQALEKIKGSAPRKTGFMVGKMTLTKGSGNVLFTISLAAGYTGFVAFGHRTRGGGYVPARDFVTPAYVGILKELGKLIKSAGGQ